MVSVIFASGGSNVGAKSLLGKWIMPPIKRQQRGSLKFQTKDSSVGGDSSSRIARPSLPPKPCIARCDIDPRGNGWLGATITLLGSQEFPGPVTNSSRGIVMSDQLLLDCCGATTCG